MTVAYRNCKWCQGRGCTFCPGELKKAEEAATQPIFTARFDNEFEMKQLKEIFGADAITASFTDSDGNYDREKGVRDIETKSLIAQLQRAARNDPEDALNQEAR